MKVLRGLVTLSGSMLSVDCELDDPVPIGHSFIVSSVRSTMIEPPSPPDGEEPEGSAGHGGDVLLSVKTWREVVWQPDIEPSLSKTMCKLELTDIISGNYTKIKATRGDYFIGHDATIEWQVIYGDEFTVQTGSSDCNDTDIEVLQPITKVSLGSSFIVYSNLTTCEYGSNSFFVAEFVGDEGVEFARTYASSGDVNSIQWFVVEWSGATVYSGSAILVDGTVTSDITTVDREKSFLLYSYSSFSDEESSESNSASRVFFKGELFSDSQVLFTTYEDDSNDSAINFFVVQHPDIYVQHGDLTVSGYSNTVTLSGVVNVNESFMPTPQLGNAYSNESSLQSINCVYNTHKLFQDGADCKVTIERGRYLTGDLYASWSVVGKPVESPTVSTLSCTSSIASIILNGEIIDDGGLDIITRGFCYIRDYKGVPTIDDGIIYEDGTFGVGTYSLTLDGLGSSRTYRIRAYAENLFGVSYGNTITCTTESTTMSEFKGVDTDDIGFVNKYKAPEY